MKPSSLHQSLLEWFQARHPGLEGLAVAKIVRVESTGVGLYAYLVDRDEDVWDRPPLDGPFIESDRLEAGGGCMLWMSGGKPVCIEAFAYGNSLPLDLMEYTLVDPETKAGPSDRPTR